MVIAGIVTIVTRKMVNTDAVISATDEQKHSTKMVVNGVKTAHAWMLIGSKRQSGIPSRKPLAIMSCYEEPMKLDSRY